MTTARFIKGQLSPFDSGFHDASVVLREAQQDADNEADAYEEDREDILKAPYLGDWTGSLINATTDRERAELGLDTPEALREYQRGAMEAVEGFFRKCPDCGTRFLPAAVPPVHSLDWLDIAQEHDTGCTWASTRAGQL